LANRVISKINSVLAELRYKEIVHGKWKKSGEPLEDAHFILIVEEGEFLIELTQLLPLLKKKPRMMKIAFYMYEVRN